MTEIWKDIKGYEGHYKISNLGGVFSVKNNKNIKPCINSGGYSLVSLVKEGRKRSHNVHRIVIDNFFQKSTSLNKVNHKNGDKSDNRVENLEWTNDSLNAKHAFVIGLRKKNYDLKKKPILIKNLEGNILFKAASNLEAAKWSGVSRSNVYSVAKGKQRMAKGFIFSYL